MPLVELAVARTRLAGQPGWQPTSSLYVV